MLIEPLQRVKDRNCRRISCFLQSRRTTIGPMRPQTRFRFSASLLCLIFFLPGCSDSPMDRPTGLDQTEILWDSWGVPHIFAAQEGNLFYAMGWAQAKSHGNLILRLYGQARGRGAEHWGQAYLPTDRWVRMMGIPDRARTWYDAQSGEWKQNLDSFAQGINAYAQDHPDQISEELKVILPVNGRDVLAHAQRVILFSFVTSQRLLPFVDQQWNPGQSAQLPRNPGGSNGWAIGPSRSESGNGSASRQSPFAPGSIFTSGMKPHLVGPGIDAYGAGLVGIPVLGIAFNDYLGWTHTVNAHDGDDLYELTLADGGYRWNGGVQEFETDPGDSHGQAGGRHPEGRKSSSSGSPVHGPVIAEKNGKVLAMRIVGLDQSAMLSEWWDMMQARRSRGIRIRFEAHADSHVYGDLCRPGWPHHAFLRWYHPDTPGRRLGLVGDRPGRHLGNPLDGNP